MIASASTRSSALHVSIPIAGRTSRSTDSTRCNDRVATAVAWLSSTNGSDSALIATVNSLVVIRCNAPATVSPVWITYGSAVRLWEIAIPRRRSWCEMSRREVGHQRGNGLVASDALVNDSSSVTSEPNHDGGTNSLTACSELNSTSASSSPP